MKTLIAILALLSFPAFAQQATPVEQALAEKLGLEVQAEINARASVIDLQRKLDAAKAEVKQLKDKYEPKTEPSK